MGLEIARRLVQGVWRTDAEEENGGGNGGSQTVNWYDFGTVTALDLIANGPQTLYTPDGPELVWFHMGRDSVTIDNGAAIGFLPWNDDLGGNLLYYVDSTDPTSPNAQDQIFQGGGNDPYPGLYVIETPFIAALHPNFSTFGGSTAALAWQAEHAYPNNALVLEAGHIQQAQNAGTSDATEPVWDNVGGTTTDNDITWQDTGLAPTVGGVHLYALIATAVTPP